MILAGFVTFIDPPKESALDSVRLLEQSGIEPKILTGDNELVTRKICEQIGLEIKAFFPVKRSNTWTCRPSPGWSGM